VKLLRRHTTPKGEAWQRHRLPMTSDADKLITDAIQAVGVHALTRRYRLLLESLEELATQWRADAHGGRPEDRDWTLARCAEALTTIVQRHRDPTFQP
jgi:hypothetical protein